MSDKNSETAVIQRSWPFWGLLNEVDKTDQVQGVFVKLSSALESSDDDLFNRFGTVGKKALALLKRRKYDELISAAFAINVEIQCFMDQYIEQETESYIHQLVTRGGWELGYLPEGSQATEHNIRLLLANWSIEWDDRPNLPSRNDVNDLGALAEYVQSDLYDENYPIQLGLVEPEIHEFYAVLSLMIICEAVHLNTLATAVNGNRIPLKIAQVEAIGFATISAVEALAFAELNQLSQEFNSYDFDQPATLAAALKAQISERVSKAALKRHAKNDTARNFVIKEWQEHHSAYKGNKTAFTRDYVRRVLNEFHTQVTEKTMREVWLKNTLSAGNAAG